ncbi:neuropeptide CCHamide-1 receptor-like [Brevipalpus obovatus]|uniref:neuropeptide CCHamide-1 receptor-like n=1 Tax=Brevipalpus obovatus TaxID=246614 RepID=UPI003D9DEEF4
MKSREFSSHLSLQLICCASICNVCIACILRYPLPICIPCILIIMADDMIENESTDDDLLVDYPNFSSHLNQTFSSVSSVLPWNSSSPSSSSQNYRPYTERPETYAVPFIFSILFLIGLIGNGTIVLVFLRHKSIRTIPNTYIISLTIGDLLVITGALPFVGTIYSYESWPHSEFVCKLSEFLRDVSISVTIFTLTVLSVDRYRAIVMPLRRYTSDREKELTLLIAFSIWTLSAVLAFPGAYSAFLKKASPSPNKTIVICYPFPEEYGDIYPKIVVALRFALLYAIPLAITTFFYLLIAHHLLSSSRQLSESSNNRVKQVRSRTKIAKIVLSFIILFAVCFFPNHVFMLWFYFYPHAKENYNIFWHYFRIASFILTFGNSCLNPLVLYLTSGTFRAYYKRYLFGRSVPLYPPRTRINSKFKPILHRKRMEAFSQNSKGSHSTIIKLVSE